MLRSMVKKAVSEVGTLEYFFVEDSSPSEFGIGISIIETGEKRVISRISADAARVRTFIETISAGTVTPVSLDEVVYDWLCS